MNEKQLATIGYVESTTDSIIHFLPTLAYSLGVLIVGFWLARRLDRILEHYFQKRQYDVSLEGFIRSLVSIGLKLIIVLTVAGMIGLPTTSLLAVFGAAGLAVGLALQGSLANFAGGVLILIFKPFKVGDVIASQGETGEVKEIQIFNTILITTDYKTVILANGAVSNGTIVNVTRLGSVRLNLKVVIDFSEDIDKVQTLLMDMLLADPQVLKHPAPAVIVTEYADSNIVLSIRPNVLPSDVSTMQTGIFKKIKQVLVENEIKSVHIKK